jgi:hypothetical protein
VSGDPKATTERALCRGRERAFKAFFLLLPLGVLGLVEAWFAWRFHREYPDTTLAVQGQYRFRPDPYRSYTLNPGYIRHHDGVTYRYNNYGFREDEDFDLSVKEPGEYRVFVMGGSAAYGGRAQEFGQYQLISQQKTYPSSETIAAHLQEELQAVLPDRKVRVINAAVVNYRIVNVYQTYLELIRTLQPDLVFTMDGWNEDWKYENPYADPVLDPAAKGGGSLAVWLRKHSYAVFYLGILYRDSVLWARLNDRFVEAVDEEGFRRMDAAAMRRELAQLDRDTPPAEGALAGRMHVYEQFANAARLDGVPVIFAIQPVLTRDRTKTFTDKEEKLLEYQWGHMRIHPTMIQHLADRLAARAAGDPSFHYMDLTDVFRDFAPDAYVDYCHLTPSANRHLAKRIAAYIEAHPELVAARPPAAAPPAVPGPAPGVPAE